MCHVYELSWSACPQQPFLLLLVVKYAKLSGYASFNVTFKESLFVLILLHLGLCCILNRFEIQLFTYKLSKEVVVSSSTVRELTSVLS